ncbi:MAG: LptA/OstA family protein [Desulfohalobiaceae bacterium]
MDIRKSNYGLWGALMLILGLVFLGASLALADEASQSKMELEKQDQEGPTKIRSNKMAYTRGENKVEFLQNVHLERPDMELWCEKLTVFLASEAGMQEANASQDFQRLEAKDGVRIEMQDRTATSKMAVYEKQKETLVLQGDVKIQEGPNQIQGQKVTIYLKEDRSEVSAGENGDRVRAVFFPEQEEGE